MIENGGVTAQNALQMALGLAGLGGQAAGIKMTGKLLEGFKVGAKTGNVRLRKG